MKTETEIRTEREKFVKKRQSVIDDLQFYSPSGKQAMLEEIGIFTVQIHWFDWILGDK